MPTTFQTLLQDRTLQEERQAKLRAENLDKLSRLIESAGTTRLKDGATLMEHVCFGADTVYIYDQPRSEWDAGVLPALKICASFIYPDQYTVSGERMVARDGDLDFVTERLVSWAFDMGARL